MVNSFFFNLESCYLGCLEGGSCCLVDGFQHDSKSCGDSETKKGKYFATTLKTQVHVTPQETV